MWLLKLLCVALVPVATANVARASTLAQYFLAPLASEYGDSLPPLKVGSVGEDSLHGVSLFHKKPSFFHKFLWKEDVVIIAGLIGACVGFVIVLMACLGRSLSKAVEARIASFETSILGVDIDIESLQFNPYTGVLEVSELTVENPKGYAGPYLLKSSKIRVELDILSLWVSFGKECHVEKILFKDLDIVLEKSESSSNVQNVLNYLTGKWGQKQPSKKAKLQELNGHTKLILHEVGITDIGVKLQVDKVLTPNNMSLRFALADIVCEDFWNDHGTNYTDDVAAILLDSVLKSVVCNVIGKAEADACCAVFKTMAQTKSESMQAAKFCNKCGFQLEEGCRFCSDCGSPKPSIRFHKEPPSPSCTPAPIMSKSEPVALGMDSTGGTLEV